MGPRTGLPGTRPGITVVKLGQREFDFGGTADGIDRSPSL
jgi:hypothetical protein